MTRAYRWFFLLIALIGSDTVTSAQVTTGTPPFGSFGGGPDAINLANLNSHIAIPVLHKPGRGLNFTYDLSYDSSVWYPVNSGGTTSWQPVSNWGWRGVTEAASGYASASSTNVTCVQCNSFTCWTATGEIVISNWVYHDPWGVPHAFSGEADLYTGACPNMPGPSTGFTSQTTDGSGYTLTVSVSGSSITSAIVTAPDGKVVSGPSYNSSSGAASSTDRNGNQVNVNGSGVFTDTLGTTALTVAGSGTPISPMTFTYTAPSGASAAYTVRYTTYTVQTNFGCGIVEYPATSNSLVSEIDLPDYNPSTNPNSKYTFAYEQTPGVPANVTGRLKSVTLPTGGTITYNYTGGNNGIICADGSTATLTRTTPDGTWTYAQVKNAGAASTTTVTDPQGNVTQIQFQGIYETQRKIYQGSTSGTLLLTTDTCYNGSASPCIGTAFTLPITRRTETIQLGSLQCKHDRFWNSFGMLTEADDYDYASGAPGPLLRQTLITYANLGSNLNAFTQTVTVKDGSGTIKSRQDTNYDQYPSGLTCITGAPQHDDSGHGCSFTARANATSVTTYTNPAGPSGGITQNFTYDSLGNLRTAQDALNNTTTLTYSPDAWANTACPPSAATYAFPVSASNALSQTTSFTYFACSGQLASAKDPNNQTTSFSYDSLLRPTQENFPDGGQTTVTYNSPTSITTTTKMNSSQNTVGALLLDGLGRTSQTQLNSDPQGVDYTDTVYDALGRVASVSNPYRSTSDPTYGLTSYQYDALGRVTKVIPPDGSSSTNNISATYAADTNAMMTTVADQAGNQRRSWTDALGRTIQVNEPAGSPPSLGTPNRTFYSFDTLSNLTQVSQHGTNESDSTQWRVRTFTYDALSRLASETNPESGITSYYYTTSGGALCSGATTQLCRRTAPAPNQTGSATVTTTYSWDALNRLTQKSYSDGTTPTAAYLYDVSSTNGVPISNPLGRLVRATTNNCMQTINSYDSMGRTTTQWLNTPSYCGPASFIPSYTYDLAGNITSSANGVGVTISYAHDTAARPTTVTSSLVDSQHPATLATVDSTLGYYPHGALRKMTPGNGLTQTVAFNKALQPCRVNVNSSGTALAACADSIPSGNVQDFNYGFNAGSANNGNVASWTATGQQGFNRTFGYDALNRISTLNQSSGNSTGCSSTFNLSWTYDAWGNRTDQNVTGGTCNAFHATVNTQNRLSGSPYEYDAAGNMTHDASHTYFYDAENRLIQVDGTLGTCSTATACYQYDAFGLRAESNHGSWQMGYIHDLSGKVVADWETSSGFTGWATGYVYLNGALLAQYQGSTTHFAHPDHLGSTRLLTGLNQSVVQNLDYLPFGELNSSDSGINTHQFTGDERDAETGLDHTWFRQYSSQLGRWMHPDPAGLAAANPANPQSWNRYAYVLNNPLALVDPFGLDCAFLNDSGDGIEEIAPELDASECGAQGGVYFAGTIDPNSFQFDPNSDFVFASGTAGNSQFSCGGANCDQGSLDAFANSLFGPSSVTITASQSGNSWSIWDTIRSMLPPLSVSGSWLVGPIVPGVLHWGPTVQITYMAQSNKICISGGLAAGTFGKSVNGGPLVLGNVQNAEAILRGFSWGANVQTSPATGAQVISNLSGKLGGPTAANAPGASFSGTYGACFGGNN